MELTSPVFHVSRTVGENGNENESFNYKLSTLGRLNFGLGASGKSEKPPRHLITGYRKPKYSALRRQLARLTNQTKAVPRIQCKQFAQLIVGINRLFRFKAVCLMAAKLKSQKHTAIKLRRNTGKKNKTSK